jgi:hypothetical protein
LGEEGSRQRARKWVAQPGEGAAEMLRSAQHDRGADRLRPITMNPRKIHHRGHGDHREELLLLFSVNSVASVVRLPSFSWHSKSCPERDSSLRSE